MTNKLSEIIDRTSLTVGIVAGLAYIDGVGSSRALIMALAFSIYCLKPLLEEVYE